MQARKPGSIKPANLDPTQAVPGQHRARRRNLQTPFALRRRRIRAGAHHAQPQRIVMIEHGLQGRDQMIFLQTSRNLQQHRLAEALDRRRRRSCSQRMIGVAGNAPMAMSGRVGCRLLDQGRQRQPSVATL